jgi:hypothetical protein
MIPPQSRSTPEMVGGNAVRELASFHFEVVCESEAGMM